MNWGMIVGVAYICLMAGISMGKDSESGDDGGEIIFGAIVTAVIFTIPFILGIYAGKVICQISK